MVQIRRQKLILSVHLSTENQKAEGKNRHKKDNVCIVYTTSQTAKVNLTSNHI